MAKDPTVRMPPSRCAACGTVLDAATPMDGGGAPAPGDLSVCVRCGQIHTIGDDLVLVALPAEDFSLLPVEIRRELRRVVDSVHATRRLRRQT